VNKNKAYHAAAGESGRYRAQTLSLQTYRVSHVVDRFKKMPDIVIKW